MPRDLYSLYKSLKAWTALESIYVTAAKLLKKKREKFKILACNHHIRNQDEISVEVMYKKDLGTLEKSCMKLVNLKITLDDI